MILLDTSVVVDCFTRDRRLLPVVVDAIDKGERLFLCTVVLYEWLRGPRMPQELAAQEFLFPSDKAWAFESAEARISAELYRSVSRARSREADIAIAACAIRHDASLWTLNRGDFTDIPGLRLARL